MWVLEESSPEDTFAKRTQIGLACFENKSTVPKATAAGRLVCFPGGRGFGVGGGCWRGGGSFVEIILNPGAEWHPCLVCPPNIAS